MRDTRGTRPGSIRGAGGDQQRLPRNLEIQPRLPELPQIETNLLLDGVRKGHVSALGPLKLDQADPIGVPLRQAIEWSVKLKAHGVQAGVRGKIERVRMRGVGPHIGGGVDVQ